MKNDFGPLVAALAFLAFGHLWIALFILLLWY